MKEYFIILIILYHQLFNTNFLIGLREFDDRDSLELMKNQMYELTRRTY